MIETADLALLDSDIIGQVTEAPEPTDLRKAGPSLDKQKEKQETAPAHPSPTLETAPAHPTEKPLALGVGPQVKEPKPFSDPPSTKDGYLFDKRMIQCKADGTPRTTPGGHWLLKKKGWEKALEIIHSEQAENFKFTEEKSQEPPPQEEKEKPPLEGPAEKMAEAEPEEIAGTEKPHLREVEPPPLEPMEGMETQETEPPPLEGVGDPTQVLKELPNREIASLITDTFIFKGISIVGSEFQPMTIDKTGATDRDRLVDQWEAYLKTTATAEKLPPWSIPLLGMVSYTTTRAMKPKSKTQSFLVSAFNRGTAKAKVWALWVRAKFTGRTTAQALEDDKAQEKK